MEQSNLRVAAVVSYKKDLQLVSWEYDVSGIRTWVQKSWKSDSKEPRLVSKLPHLASWYPNFKGGSQSKSVIRCQYAWLERRLRVSVLPSTISHIPPTLAHQACEHLATRSRCRFITSGIPLLVRNWHDNEY